MEGAEEEGRDEEGWDVNGTLSPRQGGEAQSSITESEPTVTSAQIENDGNGEGDPDADDYSARDRKMKQREKEEGEEEEDDLSSYRGITSMISKIQPVDMGDEPEGSRQSSRAETKEDKDERQRKQREEKEQKERRDSVVQHYMNKTKENMKAVGYEKLLCEEVMVTTAMKQVLENNVGKRYTRFKLIAWRTKDVFVKQYKTSGKPMFNGKHYFLKVATEDTNGEGDVVHMKVFKPVEGQGFETKLLDFTIKNTEENEIIF